MKTAREVVERAFNAAYENGYGAELEAMTAEELAFDFQEYHADAAAFDLADLVAAIRDARQCK